MDRFNGLDTLMTANAITDSRTFSAYYKEVLSRVETQGENFEGFRWGQQQLDFTYEMLMAERQVEVMASYVDLNSPALPSGKGTEITVLTGTIPRMKTQVVRGENDYRKELIALQQVKAVAAFSNVPETVSVRDYLAKTLFDTLSEIPSRHKNSLNYQVGQMKSQGALTLTADNNPRGSIRATFTAQVPSGNKTSVTWWESTGGVETAVGDPIGDIRDKIRAIRMGVNGYQNVTVEINEKSFYKLLKHDAVLKAMGYAMTGLTLRITKSNDENAVAVAKNATLDVQKEVFKQLIEADVVLFDRTQCGVEKLNTTTKKYERTLVDAFEQNVILIRPSGVIGEIKNVVPLRPDASAVTSGIYGGRGIIEYIFDKDTLVQTWRSELTALAVPTRPNDMYYLTGWVTVKDTDMPGG